MIQLASLVAAGIGPTQARLFAAPLAEACTRFGIDTPQRQAAFVAQCAHESRLFTALEEGLFYRTPERICAIFRSTVPDVGAAQPLACNPKLLACHVYANRNGNGDAASGDGWRYRGRGLIQLTGRANYSRAGQVLGRPYVDQPDLVQEPLDACLTAGWFWNAGKLNSLADAARIDDITRAVNGPAMAGAAERRALYKATLAAFLACDAAPATLAATATRGPRAAPRAAPAPVLSKPRRARRGLDARQDDSASRNETPRIHDGSRPALIRASARSAKRTAAKRAAANRTAAKRTAAKRSGATTTSKPVAAKPRPRKAKATKAAAKA